MKPSPLTRILRNTFLFLLAKKLRPFPVEFLHRPTVVIAPHQDDEVLGCGGTICRLRALDTPVHIVFLTDGSTSHKKLYPPPKMAVQRKQEAIDAARVMGVAPDHVHFLGGGEEKLGQRIPEMIDSLFHLVSQLEVDQYFIPYSLEPQPEHEAAAEICQKAISALGKPARLLEYPVWFWEHYPWIRTPVFGPKHPLGRIRHSLKSLYRLFRDFDCQVDIRDTQTQKQQALVMHISQVKGLLDDVEWQVLDDVSGGDFSACFTRPAEIFSSSRLEGRKP